MSALDPRDAELFGKLLGLLSSDRDGERAAAAFKATQFLRARELGWQDVAEALKASPIACAPQPAFAPLLHQVDARACLSSGRAWKEHELDFLRQMAAQRRQPTERQREWLDGLLDRAREWERAA